MYFLLVSCVNNHSAISVIFAINSGKSMKIGIIGCAGRMGRTIISRLSIMIQSENIQIAGGLERKGSEYIGKDIGTLSNPPSKTAVIISDNTESVIKSSEVIIDFTAPESTLACARLAAEYGVAHVIGTTGLTQQDRNQLAELARKTVIVQSNNMSIGINLLAGLVERVANITDKNWDIEIVEMHHRNKVDAPSGTALLLGESVAKGRNLVLAEVARKSRDGNTGARKEGEIGFATLRGGSVVGDHTVIFATEGERIELSHKAENRNIFANGAIRAALWTKGRSPGKLYSMKDVLGLE